MKHPVLFAAVLLAAACSESPAHRSEPAPEPQSVHFAFFDASNVCSLILDDDTSGSFELIVNRTDAALAPEQLICVTARSSAGMVAADCVNFSRAQASSAVAVSYDLKSLAPGEQTDIFLTLTETPVCDSLPQQWKVSAIRTRPEPEKIAATYIHNFTAYPVSVVEHVADNLRILSVSGENFDRQIEISGDIVRLCSGNAGAVGDKTVCEAADARQIVADAGFATSHEFSVSSSVSENGKWLNLSACYNAADNPECFIDYLLLPGADDNWKICSIGTFIDGWFLPSITINSQFFDPQKNAWNVLILRQNHNNLIFKLKDPYRGPKCPISRDNASEAGFELFINASNADYVTVTPQLAPFYCPDIHCTVPYIADFGAINDSTTTIAKGFAGTISEGAEGVKITLPCPVNGADIHNLTPLANFHPSVIIFESYTEDIFR